MGTLAILLLAASAAVASCTSLILRMSTPPFQLISSSPSPSFSNLKLSSYHIYPGGDYAVLVAPTDTDPGLSGYLNGTLADFRAHETTFITPAGSFDEGLVISRLNATYSLVEINAGQGTKGIYLSPEEVLTVNAPDSAGFYACESQLPFGPAIQVFFHIQGETVPAGCAQIILHAVFM